MLVKQIGEWSNGLWEILGGTKTFYTVLVFVVALLLTMMIIQLMNYIRILSCLPPGPWGLPIFGRLLHVNGAVHLHFNKLAKKYGNIFSVRFGSKLIVVLSDYQIIRDSFRLEEFTGRPHTDFMNIINGYGIVNTEGALWKDQRKFLHEKLRKFGITQFGCSKKNMDSRIMREVQTFLRGLAMRRGAPTNISSFLAVSISNVICSLIMSVRFHHDDSQFQRFMNLIDQGFKLFGRLTYVNYIPILRYFPFYIHNVRNQISRNREEMADFFQKIINQHKATYNENNIRDIVDTYLYEIQEAKRENRDDQLFQGKNKDRQIQQVLGDLFSAGMETVKTTLEWSVVFMLHYPEAAKAVQDELDQVIGRSRLPSLEDLPFLPITDATIQEILRRSNLVPLGAAHATTRDVVFNNYLLPAGTHVVSLLYAVHMDPELWDEPEVFRPSRFLSNEGKVYKPKFFMPFGVGRRMCLGDVLARMELFLFFSSLMHMFNLSLPEGASLPSLQGTVGVTISPGPFEVCLLQRDLDLIDCGSNEATTPLRNIGSH